MLCYSTNAPAGDIVFGEKPMGVATFWAKLAVKQNCSLDKNFSAALEF